MRKSSLGRSRRSGQPSQPAERRSRGVSADSNKRTSGIPRPGFATKGRRSSSESRENQSTQKLLSVPSIRRSHSQLSMSSVFQTPLRPSQAFLSTGSSSVSRLLTPRSDGSAPSNYKPKSRRDTRNLADKAFMAQEIHHINNFFSDKPILASLAPKGLNLRQLMLKTFVELVNYLIQCLDSTTSITMANYLEEIPFIMNRFGYPGTINNSWLKTANTQHSLPHVLGLLSWLVSLVEAANTIPIDDVCFPVDGYDEDMEEQFPYGNAKMYFDQFLVQFKAWNRGEEAVNIEQQKFFQELRKQNGLTHDDVQRAAADVEQLKEQMNDPKTLAELEALKELEKKAQILADALKQQLDYKVSSEECLNNVETKLVVLEQNCQKEEEALLKLKERSAALREKMSSQTMTVKQRDELIRICEDLRSEIRSKEESVKRIQDENYRDDLQFSKSREQLRKTTQEYNSIIVKEPCFLSELEGLLIDDHWVHPDAEGRLDEVAEVLQRLKAKLSNEKIEVSGKIGECKLSNIKMEGELSKLAQDNQLAMEDTERKQADIQALVKLSNAEGSKLKLSITQHETEIEAVLSKNSLKDARETLKKLTAKRDRGLSGLEDLKIKGKMFMEKNIKMHIKFVSNIKEAEKKHALRMQELFKR